eukprot:7335287-Heterocapsa_arctica.AAC.1
MLKDARIVVVEEPYVLEAPQWRRVQDFIVLLRRYPTIEQVILRTNAEGSDWKYRQHQIRALSTVMLYEGTQFRVEIRPGLHWRDACFFRARDTVRCELDRGAFDYLTRGEVQELARARRGKLEVSTFALSAEDAIAQGTREDLSGDAATFQASEVEELVAQHSAAQLARILRGALALARRAESGQALDPWQARKVRRLPMLRAALRVCRCAQGDESGSLLRAGSEGPPDPCSQQDLSLDEDLRQTLAEAVKEGQRHDFNWCRAWQHITDLDGSRDPGGRSAEFLVTFLRRRLDGPSRPRPWLANCRAALEAAGVDGLL